MRTNEESDPTSLLINRHIPSVLEQVTAPFFHDGAQNPKRLPLIVRGHREVVRSFVQFHGNAYLSIIQQADDGHLSGFGPLWPYQFHYRALQPKSVTGGAAQQTPGLSDNRHAVRRNSDSSRQIKSHWAGWPR